LQQHPGAALITYIFEYQQLACEAYPVMPGDKGDLGSHFLGSLSDGFLIWGVRRRWGKPTKLAEIIAPVREETQVDDFLPSSTNFHPFQ